MVTRPPRLIRLVYRPTRIIFEPRTRYSRARTRRAEAGTVALYRRPLRRTSRSDRRVRMLSRSTPGAGRRTTVTGAVDPWFDPPDEPPLGPDLLGRTSAFALSHGGPVKP